MSKLINQIDIPFGDLDIIKNIVSSAFPNQKIKLLAFGSRIKGTSKPYSDLDLAIDLNQKINKIDLFKCQDLFEESELNYKIDLIDFHSISPEFQDLINQNHIKINLNI